MSETFSRTQKRLSTENKTSTASNVHFFSNFVREKLLPDTTARCRSTTKVIRNQNIMFVLTQCTSLYLEKFVY